MGLEGRRQVMNVITDVIQGYYITVADTQGVLWIYSVQRLPSEVPYKTTQTAVPYAYLATELRNVTKLRIV